MINSWTRSPQSLRMVSTLRGFPQISDHSINPHIMGPSPMPMMSPPTGNKRTAWNWYSHKNTKHCAQHTLQVSEILSTTHSHWQSCQIMSIWQWLPHLPVEDKSLSCLGWSTGAFNTIYIMDYVTAAVPRLEKKNLKRTTNLTTQNDSWWF